MFIDYARISVKAGDGGHGMIALHHTSRPELVEG